MSEKNITDLSEMENINISEEDLPDVISEQFEAIVDIDKRIVEAENRCATAKKIKKLVKSMKKRKKKLKNDLLRRVKSRGRKRHSGLAAQHCERFLCKCLLS